MNLLTFCGIPDCAVKGCGNPGIVKLEVEGSHGPIWAYLCIFCAATEAPDCLVNLSQIANEELPKIPGGTS